MHTLELYPYLVYLLILHTFLLICLEESIPRVYTLFPQIANYEHTLLD